MRWHVLLGLGVGAWAVGCGGSPGGIPQGGPGPSGSSSAGSGSTAGSGNTPGSGSAADSGGIAASGGSSSSGAGSPGQSGQSVAGSGLSTGASGAIGSSGTAAGGSGSAGSGSIGNGDASVSSGATEPDATAGSSGAAASGSTQDSGLTCNPGIGEDTAPWRALNVTASPNQYIHSITVAGQAIQAGLDTRSAKMAGKMIVTLGVQNGAYSAFLGKRGFHVFGATQGNCGSIDDWSKGPDYDGNCRLNTLDGMTHGNQSAVTPAASIIGQVTTGLQMLENMYPAEDWGYFLNQDGSVRWSDIGFNGYSHGASSASVFAHELRAYRAVSLSGPRDNTCGYGGVGAPIAGTPGVPAGPFNPAMLPYDPNCPLASTNGGREGYASWLATPSATPIDRFYSFVGMMDIQYGDDQFDIQKQCYVGAPVDISTVAAPYNGTHRFIASKEGHGTFDGDTDALNIAYGVLPENLNPNF